MKNVNGNSGKTEKNLYFCQNVKKQWQKSQISEFFSKTFALEVIFYCKNGWLSSKKGNFHWFADRGNRKRFVVSEKRLDGRGGVKLRLFIGGK